MRAWILLFAVSAGVMLRAETRYGVQLFDMHKVEAVSLMSSEELNTLKAEINEEKRQFNRAFSTVKKAWMKRVAEAQKQGDRDFPRFPNKPFVWVRSFKTKSFTDAKAADAWLAKQKQRVDAEYTALVSAKKQAMKQAKGALTAGYSSRDEKKARKRAEKKEMESVVSEKLGEEVEMTMATLLAFNRPVPRHFVFDPVEGPDTHTAKQMAQQEAALKLYKERKEKGVETPGEGANTALGKPATAPQEPKL